jgi:hypothetical protein
MIQIVACVLTFLIIQILQKDNFVIPKSQNPLLGDSAARVKDQRRSVVAGQENAAPDRTGAPVFFAGKWGAGLAFAGML